jgi:hypothetical protein
VRRIGLWTRLIALALSAALLGLASFTAGCGGSSDRFSPPVDRLTRSTDVIVSFAEDGKRGDLPELISKHPDLATTLARSLAPHVRAEAKGHFHQKRDSLVVANYRVFGAATGASGVRLFASERVETFGSGGGRLFEGGGVSLSGPVVITLSSTLRPRRFEYGDEFCDHDANAKLMPQWAWQRWWKLGGDVQVLRQAASRWFEASGRTVRLVHLPSPSHADPHQHPYDVYALGVIPAKASGFSISRVPAPRLYGGGPMTDQQQGVSRSPDGRFTVYWPRARPAVLVHDGRGDRWLHLDGPGLYSGYVSRWAWASDTLTFDVIDIGREQSPSEMTKVHIEVDWAARRVTRVVPVGPYTGNAQP